MTDQATIGNIVSTISDTNTFNNESGFDKFAAGVDAARMGVEGLSHYLTALEKLVPGAGIAALSASISVDIKNIRDQKYTLTQPDKLTIISDALTTVELLVVAGMGTAVATAYAPIVGAIAIGLATSALYYELDHDFQVEKLVSDKLSSIFSHIDSDSAQKSLDMTTEYYKLNKEMNFSSKYDVLLDNPDIADKLMLGQEVSITNNMLNKYGLDANSFGDLLISINDNYKHGNIDLSSGRVDAGIILSSNGMAVYDPLILDLDGDGVETSGVDSKVLFDHAADGTKNATGWVGKDDGLLVRDINNNGSIDTGRELFGDNTVLSNGQKAKNAYEALADLDSNKDGVLNNQDAKYSELKIWQDANQDGISQADELKTLDQAGIASIKVAATNSTVTTLANGNSQAASSTYTKTDGTVRATAGINFVGDEFVREFTGKVDTSQVASLPDMHASGSVRDLREAAALSTDLATKLQTYANNSNNRTTADLDVLVKSWANTSSMQTLASGLKPGGHPVGGRGTNLTQDEIYKLNVIEKFTGYYGGVANFKDPAADLPNGRYSGTFLGIQMDAAAINKKYDQLLQSVDTSIAIQTNFKDSMNDVLFKFNNTGVTVDFSNLYAKVNGSNSSQVVGDITKLYTYFKNNGGDLFPASSQTEMLNWIKDRIVKDGVDPSKVNSNFEQIGFATSGDDLIITSAKSSTIDGGSGNDQIIGLSGNDTLYGGIGSDSIRGGSGNDYIAGGLGDDIIDGGDGNDTIYGNQGNNTLRGGAGDDIINGSQESNSLYQGDWAQIGNSYGYTTGYNPVGRYDGSNILEGGTGNDTLKGGWKADTYVFNKGDGNDTIIEQLKDGDWDGVKTAFKDVIQFGSDITASDIAMLRSGNDMVINVGINTSDSITVKDWFVNTDRQIEQFNFADGSTLAASALMSQNGVGLSSAGTSGNDITTGTSFADILRGLAGNDNLSGLSGNDILVGGTGNDTLDGGLGNDVYQFAIGDGNDVITDNGGSDSIQIGSGVAKNDLWFNQSGDDLVITNVKTSDQIMVKNWGLSTDNQIETIGLASGEVLSGQAVASLVQAMASFNPQPMAETSMTSAQQSQYQDMLKNTWVDPTK